MEEIVRSLGRSRACCLTGVHRRGRDDGHGGRTGVYRRPWAFRGPKALRRVGWGLALMEILLRERPAAVQVATAYEGYLALWIRRKIGLPFLVYAHGNEILGLLREANESRAVRALKAADRVVAVSHYTADLVRRVGVCSEQIEVIHPGCDVDTFRPVVPTAEERARLLGNHTTGPVLVSVGNLVERKGHDLVLRALPRLLDLAPGLVYLVIGDGPHRKCLAGLADSLGVRKHVAFAGVVPGELLPAAYGLADVFVLPSREEADSCDVEGFGLVFLEASACGVPVVAGRSGGIPDAVEAGVSGILVDPTDAGEIADAIGSLLMAPARARRMGREGRRRVLREFQWADVADSIQGVVDDMTVGARHTGLS